MARFSLSDIPDMTDRTAIVTGANSGLGRETARMLAARGARVVVAVRDPAKGQEAVSAMTGDLEVRLLDLADLASVHTFAEGLNEPIDLLINNAGLMIPPLGRTADGFELQFGINHLGHFALTNLLLSQIRGRVVTVSSNAHRAGSIDFKDLNWEHRSYRAMKAYGQSKLANLLFTFELQRLLTEAGSAVLATAAHPGLAATNLLRPTKERPWIEAIAQRLPQSAEKGAMPTLYAALADIPGNSYAGPSGLMQSYGKPKLVGRAKKASDSQLASRLWTVSEQLTGVNFPIARST